jgi:hypothetical protein
VWEPSAFDDTCRGGVAVMEPGVDAAEEIEAVVRRGRLVKTAELGSLSKELEAERFVRRGVRCGTEPGDFADDDGEDQRGEAASRSRSGWLISLTALFTRAFSSSESASCARRTFD